MTKWKLKSTTTLFITFAIFNESIFSLQNFMGFPDLRNGNTVDG